MKNTQNKEIQRAGVNHVFDVGIATELRSIELAILVHHFQYWINQNARMQRNQHDGKTWSYQTLKEITAHFPYWTIRQVETFINKLVKQEVLIKGNFNTSAYDRTVWYAFKNEEKYDVFTDISPNGEMENTKWGNGNPENVKPIPHSIPYKEKKKKREPSALPSIEFDYEINEFSGITPKDLEDWKAIYPNVDLNRELLKMRQWLIDPNNPERDGNRTFITNWLNKALKDSNKTPKKTNTKPPEEENERPVYNSSIAYSFLHDRGVQQYENYLKAVSNKKYYEDYKNGIYTKDFEQYLKDNNL